MNRRYFQLVAALVAMTPATLPASGNTTLPWHERVLYAFAGGTDGWEPNATLLADASGTLYGTTVYGGNCTVNGPYGCGTVFKLSPPRTGRSAWTKTILHSFNGVDGMAPSAPLVADANGSLFGTTQGSPINAGTVFELVRGHGGTYTERTLYQFSGGTDGGTPSSGLLIGARGVLYGEAAGGGNFRCGGSGCGVVYAVVPPAPGAMRWTETVLHRFNNDGRDGLGVEGGLTIDAQGALYGVTYGGGSVRGYGTAFKLTPPGPASRAWTERVIYAFRSTPEGNSPNAALVMGPNELLYGTTSDGGSCNGCGTAFVLIPPVRGASGSLHVLHTFFRIGSDGLSPAYPDGPLLRSAFGSLYGTGAHEGAIDGAVFRLTPLAGGGDDWVETDLYDFTGGADGGTPVGGVIHVGSVLYGTASSGGVFGSNPYGGGYGTVFALSEQ